MASVETIKIDFDFIAPEEHFRQEYQLNNPAVSNIEVSRPIKEIEDQFKGIIPANQGDVWDPRELGIEVPHGSVNKVLPFVGIRQEWLKSYTKLLVKYQSQTKTFATLRYYIQALKSFSLYLDENHPFCNGIQYIDRAVITSYLAYLKESKLKSATIRSRISGLKTLLDAGAFNNWFACPPNLIRDEDFPRVNKTIPRYIPDYVLSQLNAHLDALPAPIMRMVLVIQECGLRINELITLPVDCLSQDAQGDWFIGFMRSKVKAEHRIPISKELAVLIQEQQQYIADHFGNSFGFLFCSNSHPSEINILPEEGFGKLFKFKPKDKPMGKSRLGFYLNLLAQEYDIKDESGKLWHFQTHQFRHTVGTRMVNNGVPLHIIQRYLGHGSSEMTMTYARIHDQTLKKEFLNYQSKIVTITGEVVQDVSADLPDGELIWMRKNILAQALPNGSCARPAIKGPCPHANACLTCGDFRTTLAFLDQHKKQLAQTEEVIEQAKANGWSRQVEMNEQVAANLKNIIGSLEGGADA